MPAGLTIFNSTGTVQIDENWRNYGFRQIIPASVSAYYTSPPNPAGYAGNLHRFTVAGSPALLCACKASTLLPVKLHSYFDGSTWTFNWLFVIPGTDAVTETVEFYIFDVLDGGGFSKIGLEVFDASGQRVYHSDAPMMKLGGVQGCDTGFTGLGGHSYVPLIMRNPVFGQNLGFPFGNRLHSHALRVAGNSITTAVTGLGAFGASSSYANSGLYAAVDVTGLS